MAVETKAPTVAEEMARFSGYTTNNGQTVPADKTTTSPATTDLSDDERAAGVKIVGGEARQKTAPAEKVMLIKMELSDAEAEAALTAARDALADGEELTDEEETAALAAALTEKKAKAGKPAAQTERVKRAQEGRRRAEARAARAERNLATLEQRLAVLENGGKPLTATAPAAKKDADKEPDPKDFPLGEVDSQYIRALVRWENAQRDVERSKNQETTQLTAEQQRAAAEFTAKREAFEDAALAIYDDFQEVVLDTVGLPKTDPAAWALSTTLRDLIFESEQGPKVIYGLATDPKEAKRVDKLSKAEQMRWFFRKEAEAEAEATPEEGQEGTESAVVEKPAVKVNKLPPPPKRTNGGSGTKAVSSATTDFRAFEAMASAPPRR